MRSGNSKGHSNDSSFPQDWSPTSVMGAHLTDWKEPQELPTTRSSMPSLNHTSSRYGSSSFSSFSRKDDLTRVPLLAADTGWPEEEDYRGARPTTTSNSSVTRNIWTMTTTTTRAVQSSLSFKSSSSSSSSSLRLGIQNRMRNASKGVSRRVTSTTLSLWSVSSKIPRQCVPRKKKNPPTKLTRSHSSSTTTTVVVANATNVVKDGWNDHHDKTDDDDDDDDDDDYDGDNLYAADSSLGRVDAESWSLPPYGGGSVTTHTTTCTINELPTMAREEEFAPSVRRSSISTWLVPQESWDYDHAGMDDHDATRVLDESRDVEDLERSPDLTNRDVALPLGSSSMVVDEIMQESCDQEEGETCRRHGDRDDPDVSPAAATRAIVVADPPHMVAAAVPPPCREGNAPPVAWVTCHYDENDSLVPPKSFSDKGQEPEGTSQRC